MLKRMGISVVVVVGFVLTGCGSSVTDEQKNQAKEVLGGITLTQSMAQKARGAVDLGGRPALSILRSAVAAEDAEALGKRLKDSNCEVKAENGQTGAGGLNLGMSLNVSGDACPVEMTIEMGANEQTKTFTAKMHFAVKDPEFANLLDVTGYDMAGEFRASDDSVSGTMTGSVTSKSHGQVQWTISMRGSKSSVETTSSLKFSSFTIELKMVATENGTEHFIAGNKVSAEEFTNFMAGK